MDINKQSVYARDMIVQEELHVDEVNKMLRQPGELASFRE